MFPTKETFYQKVEENAVDVVAWKTLSLFELYRVNGTKNTRFGEALILKMTQANGSRVHVWAPKRLKNMLERKCPAQFPCYVMPTGAKVYGGDIERTYQTFELLNAEELEDL